VCGLKGDSSEALKILATVQEEFNANDIKLRAKISEGHIYNDCNDYGMARRTGEELTEILSNSSIRPDLAGCLDLARLLFAIGAKEGGADLIREIIINNHDEQGPLDECQAIFDKGRMSLDGAELIASAKKEANEMMDKGMTLWRAGELDEAVSWMRTCRPKMPSNSRFLLNNARLLIANIEKNGPNRRFIDEAREVISKADKLSPNNRRSAEMLEKLASLSKVGVTLT
jgi:tetratricopeptide (TPR) repeat protein